MNRLFPPPSCFRALGIVMFGLLLNAIGAAVFAQNPAEPSAQTSSKMAANAATAKETFDRLKRLEGKWTGRSTKGWTEAINFKTIAQGSVVHESSFDAHPNETMATMYYLDGDRLLLTHYCVSKTQPRLQATAFEDSGRKVTFTFLDGGNLPSRDKGHMDKVVLNFIDDDHFTSQWTWYQQGQEKWLEEIKYERAK
ncbi:MAG: hypothetical protein JST85_00875 [Acidobacteria bacterium]|nr:hypothetical protein [Acidobacteriota bacterium]